MGAPPIPQNQYDDQSSPLLLPQSQQTPQLHYYGIGVPEPPTTYILLPRRLLLLLHPHSSRRCRCCFSLLSSSSSLLTLSFILLLLLLLLLSLFILFPSDPQISISSIHLHRLHVTTSPFPTLGISLSLKVKIRNPDFFSLYYRSLNVAIGYRGKRLGFVSSDGGRIRARGVSYVDAELKLDGIRVISDVFYLIEDVAKGSIPFETVTEVDGLLNVLFIPIPVDGRISCEVNVNPENQTVVRQNCYPE